MPSGMNQQVGFEEAAREPHHRLAVDRQLTAWRAFALSNGGFVVLRKK